MPGCGYGVFAADVDSALAWRKSGATARSIKIKMIITDAARIGALGHQLWMI